MQNRSLGVWVAAGVALAAVAQACGSSGGNAPADAGSEAGSLLMTDCDPLVPEHCGFPFPSNVYLRDDPTGSNPSGKSVRFGAKTLPVKSTGTHVDPTFLHYLDGFSPGNAPMTYMPGAVADGLANPTTIASSIAASSPTILLEANTGKLVSHFVDIDMSASKADQRALMIRPVIRLGDKSRYIVAIRGVKDATGAVFAPSPVFKDLRDGTNVTKDPSVDSRRALYADIFAKLAAAGVPKDNLQIAWDYTTASRESMTQDLVAMRDDALAKVGADGPPFVFKSVVENPNADGSLLRSIVVTMTVPLYLDSATYAGGGPVPTIVRSASGKPKQNGTMDWDVLIHVPGNVQTDGVKHGLLQNGHGLFGSKSEGSGGFLARLAHDYHWIAFATDFFGFASADVSIAAETLSGRAELGPGFIARQQQGQLNQLLAMRMMMGGMAKNGIKDASGKVLLDPSWIDASVRAYRGDSQGGIMGAAYMSVTTDVTRGMLGEPGLPYSLLLNRSADWPTYGSVLSGAFPNGLDVQIMLGLTQMEWDRSEPDGYAPYMSQNMLPGTPAHHVLINDGIGDHQVTTLGAHILARTIGAKDLKASDGTLLRTVWGVDAVSAPVQDGNVFVEYDFGLTEPLTNVPVDPSTCDPHDRIRALLPSYEQTDEFLRTGTVTWFCDGVCNCNDQNTGRLDVPPEEVGCRATACSSPPPPVTDGGADAKSD
jgi:hypothetical protein